MKMSKDPQLDHIMASTQTMTTTGVAREYGMTARKLNQLLESAGVQRKVNKNWELCTAHQKRGLVTINEYPFMHKGGQLDAAITMKWTQIGRLLIHDIIHNHSN